MTPNIEALRADILTEFPKFKTVNKSDSLLMKSIGYFLWLISAGQNDTFMHSFVTTIGTTSYLPTFWDGYMEEEQVSLLRHERIHMRQAAHFGMFVFSMLYLFAFFPVGLSWWRAQFEMEAYTESLRAMHEYGRDITTPEHRTWMISMFTGPSYGWMWPFPSYVAGWYDSTVKQIMSEGL